MTIEVIFFGAHWYGWCRDHQWRSAPQDSVSDAADRASAHGTLFHDEPFTTIVDVVDEPYSGEDESLLQSMEASWNS